MMILYKISRLLSWIFGFHVLAILTSCHPKDGPSISSENLKYLKDKYSTETLNYFYETVFHEDDNGLSNIITKWNSNPTIAILGHPTEEEIGYVGRAISEINRLELPIKFSFSAPGDSASIKLLFGDLKEVHKFLTLDSVSISDKDTESHFGMGRSTLYDGIIDDDQIGIYFTEKYRGDSTRYMVVLEELVQSLGVIGDSYNYPSSLFFQNYNPAKYLTPLDIELLSLLYEPAIPANYSRELFERDFGDELYNVNYHQKIKSLLDSTPSVSCDDIEKSFLGDIFLKHPKEINLYVYGQIRQDDSLTIKSAILALNQISPNINISTAPSPVIEPTHGIVLVFNEVDDQESPIQSSHEKKVGKSCMYQKLIRNKVELSFNSSEKAQELRQRSIIDALYFSLVRMPHDPPPVNELYQIKESGIEFTPRYASLLQLVYSNEFVDGFKLSDFKKLN